MAHQVQVVVYHHDAVSGGDPGQGDQAHQRGNGKDPLGDVYTKDRANKGKRNAQHDLQDEIGLLEVDEEHEEGADEGQNPQHQNELRGTGLTFKLPAIDHEIAIRERHLPGHLGAQILYGTDQIAPGDVG